MTASVSTVLIVGGGMAGLTAATRLRPLGVEVIVLDKGRRPGGRMATRSDRGARFDYGAQHFGARSRRFLRQLSEWQTRGIVHEWFRSAGATPPHEGRFVGSQGMRSVPEAMAEGLGVRTGVIVTKLQRLDGGVTAFSGRDVVARADLAILTPPLPQTLHLLRMSSIPMPDAVSDMVESIEYDACLAVMAHPAEPVRLPDGHVTYDSASIAWIADNQHKGISPVPAVTIHSTPGFASEHFDSDPAEWVARLTKDASGVLGAPILRATGHRWRFSRPRTTLDIGAASITPESAIVLAGEVFAGARVEGAFLSGLAAAERALELL